VSICGDNAESGIIAELPPVFSETFAEARQQFRRLAATAQARCEWLPLSTVGPEGEPLSIDIAWLGSPAPARVVLHSSGLHGVEGFAGSAIQCDLLRQPIPLADDQALVLLHIINPFWMAWVRRANKQNVDLNRNCLAAGESYAGAPPMYDKIDRLLNPQTAAPQSYLRFALNAAWAVTRYGFTPLLRAVGGGQYDYPEGLMFGGNELQEEPAVLLEWLGNHLAATADCYLIDIHTGLGRYGQDELLVPYPDHSQEVADLRKTFGNCVRGRTNAAYAVRGPLFEAVERLLPGAAGRVMGQEFGTYSVFRVVHALSEENRYWHHNNAPFDRLHPVNQRLLESFCPADLKWRHQLLARGRAIVEMALGRKKGKAKY
jgi:hypothetical protein